jgi:hypothetical protein
MPILGIIASSFRSAGGGPESAYDSLATIATTGNVTSVTFSGIPTGYKHLQIRLSYQDTASDNSNMRFNSDTGNNYAWHELFGQGSSAGAGAASSVSFMKVAYTDNGRPGVAVVDILDYASSNKNKVMRSLCGVDNNGGGYILLRSGLWMNTAPITAVTIYPNSGAITANSTFALYGIK